MVMGLIDHLRLRVVRRCAADVLGIFAVIGQTGIRIGVIRQPPLFYGQPNSNQYDHQPKNARWVKSFLRRVAGLLLQRVIFQTSLDTDNKNNCDPGRQEKADQGKPHKQVET